MQWPKIIFQKEIAQALILRSVSKCDFTDFRNFATKNSPCSAINVQKHKVLFSSSY